MYTKQFLKVRDILLVKSKSYEITRKAEDWPAQSLRQVWWAHALQGLPTACPGLVLAKRHHSMPPIPESEWCIAEVWIKSYRLNDGTMWKTYLTYLGPVIVAPTCIAIQPLKTPLASLIMSIWNT
jgi:hypothetical protein